jgi:hypothetical protein
VTRTSASLPRLPTKITLFTLPMSLPLSPRIHVVVHVISIASILPSDPHTQA